MLEGILTKNNLQPLKMNKNHIQRIEKFLVGLKNIKNGDDFLSTIISLLNEEIKISIDEDSEKMGKFTLFAKPSYIENSFRNLLLAIKRNILNIVPHTNLFEIYTKEMVFLKKTFNIPLGKYFHSDLLSYLSKLYLANKKDKKYQLFEGLIESFLMLDLYGLLYENPSIKAIHFNGICWACLKIFQNTNQISLKTGDQEYLSAYIVPEVQSIFFKQTLYGVAIDIIEYKWKDKDSKLLEITYQEVNAFKNEHNSTMFNLILSVKIVKGEGKEIICVIPKVLEECTLKNEESTEDEYHSISQNK